MNLSEALSVIRDASDTIADLEARRDVAMVDLSVAVQERDRALLVQRHALALATLVRRSLGGDAEAFKMLPVASSRLLSMFEGPVATVGPDIADAFGMRDMPNVVIDSSGGVPVTPRPLAPVSPPRGGMALPLPPIARPVSS